MKKKIFISICCLSIIGVLCAGVVFVFFFEGFAEKSLKESLSDIRVTIINHNGKVLLDNKSDPASLPNHSDRPEVIDALKFGTGESQRFSETQQRAIYYYAIKINDAQVLRIAQVQDNFSRYTGQIILIMGSIIALVIVLCVFIARGLTRRIIKPLNAINLDGEMAVETYDELVPFVRKIEEQKRHISHQMLEVELRENITNTISDNLAEGLILIDKMGAILSVNSNALSLFGFDSSFAGKNILELTRSVTIGECVKRALAGEHFYHDFGLGSKTYQVLFSPTAQGGVIILFLDVTAKTAADRRRREFSANVSHELKTPLTTIYGYAEMLGGNMVKHADVPQVSGKIRDEAARLITLINDIIKLSELDEGEKHHTFSHFDISSLTQDITQRLSTHAASREIAIVYAPEPVMVYANKNMVEEMLYNIVDNAIKYNRQGGRVEINIATQGKKTRIDVSDTGIGIDAEHLERIFERFYRVDSSRSKKTGGTGLGLSIVKHIAEYHGGNVSATSTPHGGTNITVVL